MAASDPPPSQADVRRVRRITTVVFLGLVGAWVLFVSAQIVRQVLAPEVPASPHASCVQGLRHLDAALVRARATATEGDDDPDQALARFRAELHPAWSALEGIRSTCKTPDERRGLDALERLRYAEEHAVRREAASLTVLRRNWAAMLQDLSVPAADRAAKP
jgi:hypothetical protein